MRRVSVPIAAVLLAGSFAFAPPTAPPAVAADAVDIPIASYDIEDAAMTGSGCWTHSYDGTILDTGRTFDPGCSTPPVAGHLASYSGGGGTLNDGVISDSIDSNQLFFTRTADDSLPIEPAITLHLAQPAYVTGISLYGGDVPWNALPGALTTATVEVDGISSAFATIPFGTPNVLGVPTNDLIDLNYTEQFWHPTTTIVLKDFQAGLFGFPFDQFSITEITVEGDPATPVKIDVKPGDRDPVTVNTGRGNVPVAILGSETFDVSGVEVSGGSMFFGVYGWEVSLALSECGGPKDLNRDGYPDLVCHFVNYAIDWNVGLTTVHLNGQTIDGARFYGSDTIVTSHDKSG